MRAFIGGGGKLKCNIALAETHAYLEDQKPLTLPNLAALQLDPLQDSGPGMPSLPSVVSNDDDTEFTPSVNSDDEEENPVLIDIRKLMDLDYTLAWDLRKQLQ